MIKSPSKHCFEGLFGENDGDQTIKLPKISFEEEIGKYAPDVAIYNDLLRELLKFP